MNELFLALCQIIGAFVGFPVMVFLCAKAAALGFSRGLKCSEKLDKRK